MKANKIICLFDVDGTLTKPRNKINQDMIDCLKNLKQYVDIGYVGGSDVAKISEQLTSEGLALGNYLFSQNGLLAFQGKQVIGKQSISHFLGQEKLQKLVNFCLKYLSDVKLPCKRGTFIEYRTGMINVSPIGRNCSQSERDQYQVYDKQNEIRKKMIEALKKQFVEYNLKYSIGGQISFDVFPQGWDKTYCLKYLKQYSQIYFFGDKTFPGGNDHQLYEHLKKQDKSYSVKGPQETIQILNEKFMNRDNKKQA